MGLFHKKKTDVASASVLTESEIQKKLYGDLLAQAPHVVIGAREHFREPAPFQSSLRKSSPEKEPDVDLFSLPKESVTDPERDPLPESEQRPDEHTPRYVPLHDFESRAASQASPAIDAGASARVSNSRAWKDTLDFGAALFRKFRNPQQAAIRRFIFWGGAVLVVFVLFWGVNALNSQREVAMRTRYDIPGGTSPAPVKAPAPVVERPVVITPAPVRSNASPGVEASKTSATPAATLPLKGTYVIQVVTYPTRPDAEQIVGSLNRAGISAYIKESTRPSGRLFYVVLIGGFRTEAEAQARLLKFRVSEAARPFPDAFVKSSRT